ncbi:hypothetical protein D3C76_726750 [compost metagenome]
MESLVYYHEALYESIDRLKLLQHLRQFLLLYFQIESPNLAAQRLMIQHSLSLHRKAVLQLTIEIIAKQPLSLVWATSS